MTGPELAFGLLVFVCFVIGVVSSCVKPAPKVPMPKITVTIEPAPKKKQPAQKTEDSSTYKEAAETLKLYGYRGKSIKEMLKASGPCSSADEWVRKALESIEI